MCKDTQLNIFIGMKVRLSLEGKTRCHHAGGSDECSHTSEGDGQKIQIFCLKMTEMHFSLLFCQLFFCCFIDKNDQFSNVHSNRMKDALCFGIMCSMFTYS